MESVGYGEIIGKQLKLFLIVRKGQLGVGSENANEPSPKIVRDLAGSIIVDASAGWEHTIFLSDTGDVYVSGANNRYQLGIDEDNGYISSPFCVLSSQRIGGVCAGGEFSIVIGSKYYDFPLYKAFKSILGIENFSDFTFIVGDKKIPAHCIILRYRCSYLSEYIEDTGENTYDLTEIISSSLNMYDCHTVSAYDIAMALLEFIYCDYVYITDQVSAQILFDLSMQFKLERLTSICIRRIEGSRKLISPTTLQDDMRKILIDNSEEYSDLLFMTEDNDESDMDTLFLSHRIILLAVAPELLKTLDIDMFDAEEQEIVHIDNDVESFFKVLEFLYADVREIPNVNNS